MKTVVRYCTVFRSEPKRATAYEEMEEIKKLRNHYCILYSAYYHMGLLY